MCKCVKFLALAKAWLRQNFEAHAEFAQDPGSLAARFVFSSDAMQSNAIPDHASQRREVLEQAYKTLLSQEEQSMENSPGLLFPAALPRIRPAEVATGAVRNLSNHERTKQQQE